MEHVCVKKLFYEEKQCNPGDIIILKNKPPEGFLPFDSLSLKGQPVLIKDVSDNTYFRFIYKIKDTSERFLIYGSFSGSEAMLTVLPAFKDPERPINCAKWMPCTPEPAKEPPPFDPLRFDNGYGADQLRNGINLNLRS